MRQERDLTKGAIVKSLWLFALPLMLGNVLQQLYNLVDTWVVGRYLGKRALAAVGASYTLMTFLTSVVIGLCLGAGAFFAMAYGRREKETFRNGIFMSFTAIGGLSIVLTILLYGFVRPLTYLLQVPAETVEDMVTYLIYVFAGFFATFLYNYFASVLRSIGNSVLPLVFLGISVALNIGLDLLFVVTFSFGIAGAAVATVISQYIAGIGLMLYFLFRYSDLCPAKKDFIWEKKNFRQILSLSGFTCLQQSVMNFGILMIQGLVNSFGTTIMAAFSVAVKIDTIAYMPVQDFGNAFSFFVAQNYGAKKYTRIRKGFLLALVSVLIFCLVISAVVFGFADSLMGFFANEGSAVSAAGAEYLRVEGAFYVGIGILFLLYGYYRAVDKPVVSVVLTIISLGTRVILAYALTGLFHTGVIGIWAAIPIGWGLADLVGIMGSQRNQSRKLEINKTSQTQFILWMCFVPFQSFYKALLQNYGKQKTPQQPFDILKQETIIGNSMLLVLPIVFGPDTGGICDERNQTTVFDW